MNETQELVTVLESPDDALIAVARSLLAGNGIEYYVKNYHLQSVYGLVQTGFNPYAIQVRPGDAEKAREILEDLER